MNLTAGIQVAQLALKHRQNKKQQQRIIVFVGRYYLNNSLVYFNVHLFLTLVFFFLYFLSFTSPIKHDKSLLEAIGKKLKKNNVALDIVDFGESDDDKPEKLEALLAAVNNNNTSHIVHVPPGPNALSDVLIRYTLVISKF